MVETVTLRIKHEFLVSFVKYLQFYCFLNLHLAESYTAGRRIYSIQHGRNVFLKKFACVKRTVSFLVMALLGFFWAELNVFLCSSDRNLICIYFPFQVCEPEGKSFFFSSLFFNVCMMSIVFKIELSNLYSIYFFCYL